MKNNSVENLINELKELEGKTIYVFGQLQTFKMNDNKYLVDVIEVLESLRGCEVNLTTEVYDNATDEYKELDFENVDDYIDYMIDNGSWKKVGCDNTYNWNGEINHDITFHCYEDLSAEQYFVDLMVHKYGDVRCNYTDSVLLMFNSREEFFEIFLYGDNSYRTNLIEIDGKEYIIVARLSEEGFSVENKEGDKLFSIYGYYDNDEELKEDIRENLNEEEEE